MPRTTSGAYQLTVTRDGVKVRRRGFDDMQDATSAVAAALVCYPDCDVRLVQGDTVVLSAGPAPAGTHRP